MREAVIAVDVGSRQARAGLFDLSGTLLRTDQQAITLIQPSDAEATYRMDEIWEAVRDVVRSCAGSAAEQGVTVVGLAFDATSSLFVDRGGATLDAEGGDVFCWMDHRAQTEALEIDQTGHPYLASFGGTISPEIYLPKILWLRRHRADLFDRRIRFRDVCDELAYRATGIDAHSVSALVCKWPYLPGADDPWCRDLLDRLGLAGPDAPDLTEAPALPLATIHGRLSPAAAAAFGLSETVVVAVGAIDAEAGVLGNLSSGFSDRLDRTLLLTGGTSTNFMLIAGDGREVPGVWGPFRDVVFPGLWMYEAGQSFSGGALDALFLQHPASPGEPTAETHGRIVRDIEARREAEGAGFAAQRHLVPDWLGNRSPLNNSQVRAIVTGIGRDLDYGAFLETYYATARGIALQMRHVIAHFEQNGLAIDAVHLSGGHRHNPLLVQLYADCFAGEVSVSEAPEPVLLGTAMIAATAAGRYASLSEAAARMSARRRVIPRDPARAARLDRDYAIYLRLFETRNEIFRQSLAR